jgi:FkbM family methyltransferase
LRTTGLYYKYYDKRLHNGAWMRVCPAEHIQQQLFWYGYYEKDAVLTWETLINDTDIVIDIGANTGYYSLIAAPRARQVIAFEPSKKIRIQLQENVRRNNYNNIKIESYALSDHTGQSELYAAPAANTGMTSLLPPENFGGDKEIVPVTTLDEWIITQQLPTIRMIKIDVEGAEWKVLSGMKAILEHHQPLLLVEVIEELLAKFGNSVAAVYELLGKYGYSAYEITAPNMVVPITSPIEAYTILFVPAGFEWPGVVSRSASLRTP